MFDLELPTVDILQQVFFWVWLLLFNIGLLRFSVWHVISESESRSVVSDSLWPYGLYSLWNSPGQITGVGSFSFLQGVFPTQGSNPGLPHCRQILGLATRKVYMLSVVHSFLLLSTTKCHSLLTRVPVEGYLNCFYFFFPRHRHSFLLGLLRVCVCVCVCVCIIDTHRLG